MAAPKWAWAPISEGDGLVSLIRSLNPKMLELQRALVGGSGAPVGAHYLVDLADATLTAEVVVSAIGKSMAIAANAAAERTLLELGPLAILSAIGLEETYYAAHVQGGGGITPWYCLGSNSNSALTTGAVAANTLYAVPFVAPGRGATLDRIAFNVTTLLAGNARCGIYDATSLTNLYPNALIEDGGSISTGTTGVKSTTISRALTPGKLYWAVFVADVAVTVRTHQAGTVSNILGFDSTLPNGGNRGLSVAFTFAALPSTFPASATLITTGTNIPAVFGRFGA